MAQPTSVSIAAVAGQPVAFGVAPPPPPPPPPPAGSLVLTAPTTATVGTAGSASIQNTTSGALAWTLAGSGVTPNPASGTLAAGATATIALTFAVAGSATLTLTRADGGAVTGGSSGAGSSTITVAPRPQLVLSGGAAGGLVGVASAPWTITGINLPAGTTNVSIARTPSGTLSTPGLALTPAAPSGQFTLTPVAAGVHTLSFTNDRGIDPIADVTYDASSPPAPPPPPPSPTTATMSGSDQATINSPHTSTVTLNAPADQTYTITWSRSNGATGPATSQITAGQTSVSATSTWTAIGTGRSVDFTISPALTRLGNPLGVTVSDFAWAFAPGDDLNLKANATTVLATGVPTAHTLQVSPDLLPGITTRINGTQAEAVGDATVPQILSTDTDPVRSAVRDRDVVFEVLDSPIATIVNVTRGITYEYGTDYTGRTSNQPANRWNAVMREANPGDIIEVSPGAIHGNSSDFQNYWNGNLDSTLLAVVKPVTIRGMAGRGRWRPYVDRTPAAGGQNGITIFAPAEGWDITTRGNIVLSDFEMDAWGKNGNSFGIKVRANYITTNSWNDYHQSVTVRNFKVGRPPYERSASGFEGSAETWVIENGHIYDCGAGEGSPDGRDHNFYISARTMTIRGVRSERTRGNTALGWWEGGSDMDGHHMKLSFIDGLIEGCAIVTGPRGDASLNVQAKAGGNLVMRGNLIVGGRYTQNGGTGMVTMLREYANGNVATPNFNLWWDAFRSGNSMLIERNVFITHLGRPLVFFWPASAGVGGGYMAQGAGPDQISSVIVRDNIGMAPTTPTEIAPFSEAKWILNDPTGGGSWTGRGNVAASYSVTENWFADREILKYGSVLAPTAAGTGSLTYPAFTWPHGSVSVTRSNKGLD